ncbi:MAG: ABC transporter ATP-binding protein [Chloroflexota bacterium]
MIEAKALTKRFQDFTAVNQLDLQVSEGEVLAILGPNGAGKTTTVRMLGSILRPTSGQATVAGYDTVKDAEAVRQMIGLLTEFPGLYTRMKGVEYLHFFGELQGLPKKVRVTRIETLLKQFQLWDAREKRLGEYSKGMKQKLTLVRAMLHDPQVLFLDEPTSTMDPHSAKLVRDAILQLRQEKRTIVICTHNLAEAELLADRIAIIRQGEIIASGTSAVLKQQLLGDPVMDLRLGQPLNGQMQQVEDWVTIIDSGPQWLRYSTADPETTNPKLVQLFTQTQVPVVTLSEVSRSLEEVYLKIVADDEAGLPFDGQPHHKEEQV